ncbi:MAG: helicase-exonuclease AddAB subunit AddA [Clostridiales bacterium]|nr:helicase-exonuclease AddAB subunit AddA [Clostridiales bacterium]
MPEWTMAQKKVIETRDKDILVAAAAGSGKTAVLVERIIRKILDEKIGVDQFLVVTFTEAAAGEMKERIQRALEKAREAGDTSAFLERQISLMANARITTIHSFCLSVIRDYYYRIDLDPSFSVMDDGEGKLIAGDVLEDLVEDLYAGKTELDPLEFFDFADSVNYGGNTKGLKDSIQKLYQEIISYPDAMNRLLDFREMCSREHTEKIFSQVVEDSRRALLPIKEGFVRLKEAMIKDSLPEAHVALIGDDIELLESIINAPTEEQFIASLKSFRADSKSWVRYNKKYGFTKEELESYKRQRDDLKLIVEEERKGYIRDSREEFLEDMYEAAKRSRVLIDITHMFIERFGKAKRDGGRIDFSDMEQFAFDILTERNSKGEYVPSETAKSLAQSFNEIMVDEYQDSSFIQEAILKAVSGSEAHPHNRFMVGDVKQSIYRFRQAKPELFMEKFRSYALEKNPDCVRIDLDRNFRSREEIIDGVNEVFDYCMNPLSGEIDYSQGHSLVCGASYPGESPGKIECCFITENKGNPDLREAEGSGEADFSTKLERESVLIANKIRELIMWGRVTDKETGKLRPVRYGDIAILVRAAEGVADSMLKILNREGIPAYTNGRTGFFAAEEIVLVLNLLRIIDNYRQDIPLASVMHSEIGEFTSEELARIRSENMEVSFWQGVVNISETPTELGRRVFAFLKIIENYRFRVSYTPLYRLLDEILKETGYYDYLELHPYGRQKMANLEFLIRKAMIFEQNGNKGVFRFLRYVDKLTSREFNLGEVNCEDENSDIVRIMTIHKSKGLEFPIVFLADTGRRFRSEGSMIMVDKDLGVAMPAFDSVNRIKSETCLHAALIKKNNEAAKEEALRVFYVAMTRAKEKLFITGTADKKTLESGERIIGKCLTKPELSNANSYIRLMLPLFLRSGKFNCTFVDPGEIISTAARESKAEVSGIREKPEADTLDPNWVYPFRDLAEVPIKMSVSDIKKAGWPSDEEQDERFKEEVPIPLIPQFIEEKEVNRGAFAGTAYHRFLELYDYKKDPGAKEEVSRLREAGLISEEEEKCLNIRKLQRFLDSGLARRMKAAEDRGLLEREKMFMLGEPDEATGEYYLVQGVIDAFFEENGEIVLLDYKTDWVSEEEPLIKRYKIQLDLYRQAIERLYHRKVSEVLIYSFCLDRTITI